MPLLCGITFKYLEILSLPWYEWGSNKRVINLCSWNHPISDKSYTENCPYPALFALSGSCPSWLTHNPKHPGTCPESLPLALLSSSEVWLRYSPGDKRSRKRTLRIPANFLTRTLSLSSTLFQKELLERRTVSREEELHRLFSLFFWFGSISRLVCLFWWCGSIMTNSSLPPSSIKEWVEMGLFQRLGWFSVWRFHYRSDIFGNWIALFALWVKLWADSNHTRVVYTYGNRNCKYKSPMFVAIHGKRNKKVLICCEKIKKQKHVYTCVYFSILINYIFRV